MRYLEFGALESEALDEIVTLEHVDPPKSTM